MRPRFCRSDLWWILAYPVYQILGTIRHEGSHVVVGMLEGAQIVDFQILPTLGGTPWVIWGYVSFVGMTSWLTGAAPYFCDLVTFALAFWLLSTFRFKRHWIWVNIVILGLITPLLNSLFNYTKLFYARGETRGDVVRLMNALPDVLVHGYFLLTMGAYAIVLVFVLRGQSVMGSGDPAHPLDQHGAEP